MVTPQAELEATVAAFMAGQPEGVEATWQLSTPGTYMFSYDPSGRTIAEMNEPNRYRHQAFECFEDVGEDGTPELFIRPLSLEDFIGGIAFAKNVRVAEGEVPTLARVLDERLKNG